MGVLTATLSSTVVAPDDAGASTYAPGTSGYLNNVFYAYVQEGETIAVGGPATVSVRPPSGPASTGSGTFTADASDEGVWIIEYSQTYNYWSVVVSDPSGEIPGRVWANRYALSQTSGPAYQIDLAYYAINDAGYRYNIELNGYNGINSTIIANSAGNVADANCAPLYRSTEYVQSDFPNGGFPPVEDCGEYRIFFEPLAADLPAQAPSADGVLSVAPDPLDPDDLTVDIGFVPTAQYASTGQFTMAIDPRFTGTYELAIDTDGNGLYSDAVDRIIPLGANGAGSYTYDFDGLDGAGNEIAECSTMNARVQIDRLGELHVVQTDVEGRSGLEVTRTNGPGAPNSLIYWNDTFVTSPRSNTTPVLDGTAGVSSAGGVHGWDYDSNSWGNTRVIDDWTFLPVDLALGETQITGDCTALSIEKTSDATAATRSGDTVTYTVTATNTGASDYTDQSPAVVFDDLSGVVDDADYNEDATASRPGTPSYSPASFLLSWTGELPAGESVAISYSVTLKPGGDGTVRNVAWQPADPENPVAPACDPPDAGGLDSDTSEPCATTSLDLPRLSITKAADQEELPAIGDVVEYTVRVTNEGPGDYTVAAPATMTDDLSDVIDDADFNDDAAASVGTLSYDEPTLSWSGVLAAGDSATITYSASYTGGGDRNLQNSACVPADQVAPGGEPCASVAVAGAKLVQWKQVESSATPAVAGSVLTYTLSFRNDGETLATVDAVDDLTHVSDDGDVTTEPTSADGLTVARDGDRIAVSGSVPAGETYSVTYQVALKADGERGDDIATNFLLAPDADVPAEPVCEPSDAEFPSCTTTLIGAVTYAKSVEASADPVVPGTVLTYTITVDNTGTATVPVSREDVLVGVLDDADLTSNPVSGNASVTVSDVADGRFQIAGELPGGDTALVTYEVTVKPVADRGDNKATNFLVNPSDTPPAECGAEDLSCTVTPLPAIETAKSSDPESGSTVTAGQDLTYTLTFTNSGEAAGAVDHIDDLSGVLDDADLIGELVVSDGSLGVANLGDGQLAVMGGLDAGQSVTVTYTVTVKADGDRGDNLLGNFLVPTGEEPPAECVADNPNCTENLISELVDTKSVDLDPKTPSVAGQELTYTLTFTNQGTGAGQVDRVDDLTHVVDDATVTGEPVASDAALAVSRDGKRISVVGELAAGQEVTVTYKVTVNADGERGDGILANYLLNPDESTPAEPVCEPIDGEAPDCTINSVLGGSEEPPVTQPPGETPPPSGDNPPQGPDGKVTPQPTVPATPPAAPKPGTPPGAVNPVTPPAAQVAQQAPPAQATASQLPRTGTSPATKLMLAAMLLLAGTALVTTSRRRRRNWAG